MKKKLLIILLFIFGSGSSLTFSQNLEFEIAGPNEVLDYNQAVYTVTRYKEPPIDFGASVSTDTFEAGWILDRKEESLGGNIFKTTYTLLFLHEGSYKIFGRYPVTVKPNPLKIELPLHICPYGTQLVINKISPAIQRTFTVTGSNPTAKISDMGILTYDPTSAGTINVKYEQNFRNGRCYQVIEVYNIKLISHGFYATYYRENNGRVESIDVSNYNYITKGEVVEIRDFNNYEDFTWELPYGGAKDIQYNKAMRTFKFTPTVSIGDVIKLKFKYKYSGCSQYVTFDCYFEIDIPYNVSYSASSNVIRISKDSDSGNLGRIVNTPETYKLVNTATGVIKKEGQLIYGVNEISVSDISNGIYAVQIIAGSKVKSYKVSINRK